MPEDNTARGKSRSAAAIATMRQGIEAQADRHDKKPISWLANVAGGAIGAIVGFGLHATYPDLISIGGIPLLSVATAASASIVAKTIQNLYKNRWRASLTRIATNIASRPNISFEKFGEIAVTMSIVNNEKLHGTDLTEALILAQSRTGPQPVQLIATNSEGQLRLRLDKQDPGDLN